MKAIQKLLGALALGLAFSAPNIAAAQTACPKNQELVRAFQTAQADLMQRQARVGWDDAFAVNRAYAILFWQGAGYQIFDDDKAVVRGPLARCEDLPCGLPETLEGTQFQEFLNFRQGQFDYNYGRRSDYPTAPLGAPFPDVSMLNWAEDVLDCKWDFGVIQAAPATTAQQADPKWRGYEAALNAGGQTFRDWWGRNFELRSTQDAFSLCNRFGSSSYECGLVAEWTYLNAGRNPYTGGSTQTYQGGVYSDSGNNPYNAGYNGPTGSNTYTPPSNEPRCYDQGDGTERCFYD